MFLRRLAPVLASESAAASRSRRGLAAMKPSADLCDENEAAMVLQAHALKDYGKRRLFFGPVATVEVFEDNTMVSKKLDEPGEGRVLFVDGKGSLNCALFGDMMGAKAIRNGWAGVVINGAVRDAAQLLEMDLGVKALGTCPKKSLKGSGYGKLDVSLSMLGVSGIKPGMFAVADHDGVVVLGTKPKL